MKKIVFVSGIVLAYSLVASAQDVPRVEAFMGFDYTRVNSADKVPAFNASGGAGQFVVNFSKTVGWVTDVGAVHNGNIQSYNTDTTLVNFLFGPRVSIRKSRFTPYFQVLFGGEHAGTSKSIIVTVPSTGQLPVWYPGLGTVNSGGSITARAVASQTVFSMTAGGGLDIKINKTMSFRPIQLEYQLTRLQSLLAQQDSNQHHLRYLTGFNFTFGAR